MEFTDFLVPWSVLHTLDQILHVSVIPPPCYFLLMLRIRPNSAVHLHTFELLENKRFLSLPVHQFCPR